MGSELSGIRLKHPADFRVGLPQAPAWQALYERGESNTSFCAKRETSANREMRGGENEFFSSPSSRASGKMSRSPLLAHKASVMEAKSSVHRPVFIVFNYNFSAFRSQKFSV